MIIKLLNLVIYGLQIYSLAIVVHVLLSWFPGAYETKFGQILIKLVEPIESKLSFIRIGMISFAPIAALFLIQLAIKGVEVIQLILARLMGS
nr:YggT family protein [Lactobacillus sp. S2-2]